jgi:ribosomal protein S18 acetylase RimI-like enzyme
VREAATLADIERAAVAAWPALETTPIGGWLWRSSSGGSGRANSVSCLAAPGLDVEAAVTEAEARYRARGAPARFQITDVAVPADLDAFLAARGYEAYDACTTLARALTAADATMPSGIVLCDRPGDDWFDVYASVITPDRRTVAPRILERVPRPCAFVGATSDGRIAATVLAVLVGPIVIVECVATAEVARRRGVARTAMQGAMAWAAEQGATTAALGVVAANAPAQALYRGLGFEQIGRYHLRRKDVP